MVSCASSLHPGELPSLTSLSREPGGAQGSWCRCHPQYTDSEPDLEPPLAPSAPAGLRRPHRVSTMDCLSEAQLPCLSGSPLVQNNQWLGCLGKVLLGLGKILLGLGSLLLPLARARLCPMVCGPPSFGCFWPAQTLHHSLVVSLLSPVLHPHPFIRPAPSLWSSLCQPEGSPSRAGKVRSQPGAGLDSAGDGRRHTW